ncbi:hypothetical protein BDY19DRAFT_954845 [Irpex rosettiformis]|uniref:Uncharacterized protein n=1 Tax=Irpex rosettiformis TaxID=378272 RepID=A0ACB8TZ76_9APHY|nr:hypothetical protein BDY19DRAFT_954845 [Irpex rosettiformis]
MATKRCLITYQNRICSMSRLSSTTMKRQQMHSANVSTPAKETVQSNTAKAEKTDQRLQPEQAKPMSIAERDAMLMNAWKDREGSLANAEFEDGKVEEGYKRNVKANIFRYI